MFFCNSFEFSVLTFFQSFIVILLLFCISCHGMVWYHVFCIYWASQSFLLKLIWNISKMLSSCWNLYHKKAALLTAGIQITFHYIIKLKAVWLLQYLKIWQIVNHHTKCQANQNVNQPNWALGSKCHLKHLHAPGARFCAPEVQNKYGRRLCTHTKNIMQILNIS